MATPMITNWKKLHASKEELVDPTLYLHLISSLMYLFNTKIYLCFVVNTLIQFMVEPRRVHWVATKHVLIPCKDSGIWYILQEVGWCYIGWIHKFILGL